MNWPSMVQGVADMERGPNGASAESIEALLPALRQKLLDSITAALSTALADAATRARQMVQTERRTLEGERQALHQQIADGQNHLEKERETSRTLAAQLALVRAAKESDEASHVEAQNKLEQMSAALADRVHALEGELEEGRAQAVRLANDVELERVERRRALAVLDSIRSTIGVGFARPRQGSAAPADVRPEAPDLMPPRVERAAASESARPLKLVTADPTPNNASWSEYATQLLEQIEASHQYDVESLEHASDVVDRLTEYLRMARELFLTRFKEEPAAAEEFDRQMGRLLDTKGATTFARHLGIAWYAICRPARAETPPAVA
jgi:hypothetical protein